MRSRTSKDSVSGPHSSIGIKALDRESVGRLVVSAGEPAYRGAQLVRWLYARSASTYDQMTDLPSGLRTFLAEEWPLHVPELVSMQVSELDGTRKYLWRLADGETVESVGLPDGDRLTVCFSTQVGCAMGCSFCATGQSGFVRDLGAGEMADQVGLIGRDFGRRVTNAVAMGQGEPFANYDATLGGVRLMNSPDGLGIGARHLTVSTCGLISGVRRFAREPEQFTLAVSLHSAVQATRDVLMPGMRGTTLDALRKALAEYSEATGRRPSLEYALIAGVNDTAAEAEALAHYCTGLLVHVNLIPANPVAGTGYGRAQESVTRMFKQRLTAAGIETSVRSERGADIDAACGQLRQRER